MRTPRGVIAAVAAVVSAIGVAGCGDSGSAAEDGTSAAQSASPEVRALLLTAEELPAGFRTMPIPAGQVAQAANGVLDVAKGATISPPECAPAGTATDDDAGMVMLMAVSGSTTVTETVTPAGGGSLDDIRASRTGQCATVTATIANGDSTAAESTITNTPLDLHVTAADDVFAVEQTSTSTFNGREVAATTLLAWATVGDYAVTVTSAGAVADDPDVDTFEKTVVAAVDKVASAAN